MDGGLGSTDTLELVVAVDVADVETATGVELNDRTQIFYDGFLFVIGNMRSREMVRRKVCPWT
jgi:hypothetical protein